MCCVPDFRVEREFYRVCESMPGFQISPFAPFCFCVWVAFLQVKILIALWRCSSARGCGAEYQPFQVVFNISIRVFNISLSPSFSVCISCSVPIVLSGYTKIAGMERRGKCHHFVPLVPPWGVAGTCSCAKEQVLLSDQDLRCLVPLVSHRR